MYTEVIDIIPTPDQDRGLTIAFKNAVIAAAAADDRVLPYATPGAFLAARVVAILDSFVDTTIRRVVNSKLDAAFNAASQKDQESVAAILKFDLIVPIPTDATT